MGIYKSFNYEIFERRPSIVIGFDGNSAGANLIQEAKNGKGKASIFVYSGSKGLKEKAESLEGYVTFFEDESAAEKVRQLSQFVCSMLYLCNYGLKIIPEKFGYVTEN